MITNLFSMFDPSSSIMKLSWLSIVIIMIIQPIIMWKNTSTAMKMKNKIMITLKKEVLYTLKKTESGVERVILIAFIAILSMNFMAIYPQIFSPTSHLTITLPISLTLWTSLMIFGWVNNTNHILSHLVPQGTPNALIIFIVIIELVRNLIRPVTLCVRLTANLIAGHLLITLLGNFIIRINVTLIPVIILAPIVLTTLESAVAFIQSYVFVTLITLYRSETKYWKTNLILFT